jgi:hypothetical protein
VLVAVAVVQAVRVAALLAQALPLLGQVPVLVAVVEVAAEEPLSSRGLDHTQQLPLLESRSRCASKDCKMHCWCHSDRYEPHY